MSGGSSKEEVLKEIEVWADERAKKEGVDDDKGHNQNGPSSRENRF